MGGTARGDGTLTLAFELEAFNRLAYPRAAFADARQWSDHVGVVADDTRAVELAVRRSGVRQDYEIGELDAQSVLSRLKWETETDRYVFVGTDEQDEALAQYVNWEYRPLSLAATKAGWQLRSDLTLFGRLHARIVRWMGPLTRWGDTHSRL